LGISLAEDGILSSVGKVESANFQSFPCPDKLKIRILRVLRVEISHKEHF